MKANRRALLHIESGPFPLVADPEQAFSVWRTGYAILEVARVHAGAPEGALYVCHGADLRLLAVRGVDQSALDLVANAWHERCNDFMQGQSWAVSEPPSVVLACADDRGLAGLALLCWPARTPPSSLSALRPLSQVLATLLRRLRGDADDASDFETPAPVEQTWPQDGVHAMRTSRRAPGDVLHLRVLLDENEWNIARVARILGVTRMTIYNRLRRQGVKRKRVPKSLPRPVARRVVDVIASPVLKDEPTEPGQPAERTEAPSQEQPAVLTEA